jgi:hypothetical protein
LTTHDTLEYELGPVFMTAVKVVELAVLAAMDVDKTFPPVMLQV